MRIGFDARLINETGVGRYIENLLEELKVDRQNEYFIFLTPAAFKEFRLPGKNWQKIAIDLRWHSLKEQLLMPFILNKYSLDLVHFPYFNVPFFYRGKYLITVHDLIIDHFLTGRASTLPSLIYILKFMFYKLVLSNALRNAVKIFAISSSTKNEIIKHYKIKPEKIIVTYDALDRGILNIKNRQFGKKIYKFEYILYVGNAYPHKNLEKLINLFADPRINSRAKLVLTGDDWFFYPRLKKSVKDNHLSQFVIFFGHANDLQLASLYSHAKGLVIPSLMEGFGLPNLEAVFYNCLPVVSDIPVFREVWGNDLLFFDPHNGQDLKVAVLKLLNLDKNERLKRLTSAKKRLGLFSWKKTAKATQLQYLKS